jgi:CubicO group peptidase (beta-lactamase class C family)
VEQLNSEPGTVFDDSWTENVLQALIVEAVDGRPLAQFLEEEVFSVAGFQAEIDGGTPDIAGVAESYPGSGLTPAPKSQREAVGDVGIYTTASELAEWGAQHWAPSVGGDELLQQRTAHMVLARDVRATIADEGSPDADDPRNGFFWYGAGLFANVDGERHTIIIDAPPGDHRGFASNLQVVASERVAAAVLCNGPSSDVHEISDRLVTAYLEARGPAAAQ